MLMIPPYAHPNQDTIQSTPTIINTTYLGIRYIDMLVLLLSL